MKYLLVVCLFVTSYFPAFAQKEAQDFKAKELANKNLLSKEMKDQLIKHDLSSIFIHADNSQVYGFIGPTYERLRIKFISVTKNPQSPGVYDVYGKSMVKTNIDVFHGTIKVSNIRKYNDTSNGVDDEYKGKGIKGQFIIVGDYNFSEDAQQAHSGIFNGTFHSYFYVDKKDEVHYDEIEIGYDGYENNQFVGQWQSYKNNITKRCNWGDYRIPNSEDLDVGAGEFSPRDKYLKFGWQSRRDLFTSGISQKKAKELETAKWWK